MWGLGPSPIASRWSSKLPPAIHEFEARARLKKQERLQSIQEKKKKEEKEIPKIHITDRQVVGNGNRYLVYFGGLNSLLQLSQIADEEPSKATWIPLSKLPKYYKVHSFSVFL